jgi:hypothetical protein
MDAGRIDKDELGTGLGVNTDDAVSGSLRVMARNGEALADDGVEQRALAHVGATNQSDPADACWALWRKHRA